MTTLYKTRNEAKRACIREAEWATAFARKAIRHAENGEVTKAWGATDNATCAAKCAMKAHDELWELAHEKLTEDEFKAFCAAEEAFNEANRAARLSAEAGQKAQAEFDAKRRS